MNVFTIKIKSIVRNVTIKNVILYHYKMKYFNYTKLGVPTTPTDHPVYANSIWEIDQTTGKLLGMIFPDGNDIKSSEDKGITWSTEVSGTAGVFISYWHDRSNELIYMIQSDAVNPGETYVVDYSTWSNITITKHNGDLGITLQSLHRSDIFLRDGNLEAIVCNNAQIDARRYNNPWASIDTNPDNVTYVGRVVVVGTVAYFYGDISTTNILGMYKFDGATVTTLDTIAATSYAGTSAGTNMAYDGTNLIYFIANDDGTGDNYLYSYNISGDVITKHGKADYYLMNDRDTATGVKEKAWDNIVDNFGVYQLHDVIKYQLYKIAIPDITTGYTIHTVTDNFLWARKLNGAYAVEVWEYEDKIRKLITFDGVHEIMESPGGDITLKKDAIPIENNMIMKFVDNYTSAGSTSEEIVFEGIIYKHTETEEQTINLESLAEIDLDMRPSGDYSGRSDEIITSLLTDYCSYITKGTFSVGTAMGTITFGGDKTLGTILDELVYFENWIWYLTPIGVLYFNNGTVDSLVNLSETDNVHFVKPSRPREIYNRIKVKGAYIAGVLVESAWQEDLESQQAIGIKPRSFTFSFLNTVALCNTAATNLLTRLGKEPLKVVFTHQDITVGFMQPGETITFEFNRGGIIVSSDQFLITEVIYIDQSVGVYTIRDELP